MEKKLAKERGRGKRREMDILWHYSLDFGVWKRGLLSAAVCSISCMHLAKGNFFNALIFTQIGSLHVSSTSRGPNRPLCQPSVEITSLRESCVQIGLSHGGDK